MKDYAKVASPLIALTQKAAVFKWGAEEQRAFEALKGRLVSAPILGYPDMQEKFILDTDVSKCAIGAVLSQVQDGKEVVIAYGSRRLTKSERNYCVTRQELLAIVWFHGPLQALPDRQEVPTQDGPWLPEVVVWIQGP